MQQRNSNLRELPVAPGNTDMNSGFPASNVRPVAKATQGLRPGQSTQPIPVGGRGRGQVAAKTELQPGGEGSTTFRKETQSAQSSTASQVSMLTVRLKFKNIIIIKIKKRGNKHRIVMDTDFYMCKLCFGKFCIYYSKLCSFFVICLASSIM